MSNRILGMHESSALDTLNRNLKKVAVSVSLFSVTVFFGAVAIKSILVILGA